MASIASENQVPTEPTKGGRNALNFWIDLITTVAFTVLLSTSFIMKFILPPGTCDEVGKVKVWLGHSRHWWGDIHYWVAILMLALIVVHVWLHWSWVKGLWGKLLGRTYAPRSAAMLVLMVGLLVVPFIVPYEYWPVEGHEAPVLAEADSAAETVPASVAPCGVDGLSCDTCPAADDRLFGGGCAGEEPAPGEVQLLGPAAEEDEAADDSACEDESACATCPNAGSCDEAEPVEEVPADSADEADCDGSACSTCPSAGDCDGTSG